MVDIRVKILLVAAVWVEFVKADDEGCYEFGFTDKPDPCKDTKKDYINADGMKLVRFVRNGEEVMGLDGDLLIGKQLLGEYEMNMNAELLTEHGRQVAMKSSILLEKSFDEDAPWWPIFEQLNVTGCPIPEKNYKMEDIVIPKEKMDPLMNYENAGEYIITLSIVDKANILACIEIGASIFEVDCPE